MKKIVFFFLFLCSTFLVYGIEDCDNKIIAGRECLLMSIDNCEIVKIYLEGEKKIDDEIMFRNCSKINNTQWECSCNNTRKDIIIDTEINTVNKYNIDIQYFVKEVSNNNDVVSDSHSSWRSYYVKYINSTGETNYEDINGNQVKKEDIPDNSTILDKETQERIKEFNNIDVSKNEDKKEMPKMDNSIFLILGGAIIIFGVLLLLSYLIYKKLLKSDEDNIDKIEDKKVDKNIKDEDVEEYLRKLS